MGWVLALDVRRNDLDCWRASRRKTFHGAPGEKADRISGTAKGGYTRSRSVWYDAQTTCL